MRMIGQFMLLALGFAVGAFGTMIGVGGGFILVPLLLLLYPQFSPRLITSITLSIIFFNTLSGSMAYHRMGRIDYRSGFIFAAATIPGAVLGVLATWFLRRGFYDLIFGIFLLFMSAFIFLSGPRSKAEPLASPRRTERVLIDGQGKLYRYSFRRGLGVGLSFVIGFLSSIMGIGGGLIHVPVLIRFLDFPVHIATATSHFMLAIMTFVASAVHAAAGDFKGGLYVTAMLAIGVLGGAQLGARLSNMIRETLIVKLLAIGLAFVGLRLIYNFLQ